MEKPSELILEQIINRHKKYKPIATYCQKEIEEIIEALASELKYPKEIIREVWVSQFRFVNKVVANCVKPDKENFNIDYYMSVRLPLFGRFEVKKSFKNKFNK